jgi:uncharacterized RDD family membrane protein YckC
MSSASLPDDPPDPARYARFSRRLKGMFIDWTITLVVIFGALMIAASARNDNVSQALGAVVVLALILYEPLLVSRTGGTIGHHLTNLRVVDDGSGGNVNFLKAVARFAIKSVIGWYSFLLMALTRRNQAVHDLVTRSTVQIRDAAKAAPGQFITERVELAHPDMPSPLRRIAVIAAYLLLTVVVALAAEGVIVTGGIVSEQCGEADICTTREVIAIFVLGGTFLAACVASIVLGWKGRLFGARRS